MAKLADLLPGTLDLLILKAVSLGPLHGYGILLRIQQTSKQLLQIEQGSLYPALYRLEERGLIRAEWEETANGRRAKVYSLTSSGRKQLADQRATWERFSGALAAILKTT